MDPDLVSEVVPGRLFIGSCDIRLKPQLFHDLEIKRVIALGSAIEFKYYQSEPVPSEIEQHEFILEDSYRGEILPLVREAVELIEESLKKNEAVLVHCAAGVNRSATVVIAYLMRSRKLTVAEALRELKKVRPRVNPNSSFLQQLEGFE